MTAALSEIIAFLDAHYPPQLAESWDEVGLVVGDPKAEITKIGFAVDPCEATIKEAIEREAQLLITHHPLYLRGTSTVGAHTAKGSWVHQLIKNDCALFAMHTNADAAIDGSASALADLLKLENQVPLSPSAPIDGVINPNLGIGKVGELPLSMSLRELGQRLQALLPETAAGILMGGDPEKIVKKVALSPGSGDSFLSTVRDLDVDVYITADLRHHPATDHLWGGGCALIGLTHFASEWPLLVNLREAVANNFPVETYISTLLTDPWNIRI